MWSCGPPSCLAARRSTFAGTHSWGTDTHPTAMAKPRVTVLFSFCLSPLVVLILLCKNLGLCLSPCSLVGALALLRGSPSPVLNAAHFNAVGFTALPPPPTAAAGFTFPSNIACTSARVCESKSRSSAGGSEGKDSSPQPCPSILECYRGGRGRNASRLHAHV